MDGGIGCAPTRQSQVGEEQTKITVIMTDLSKEIDRLEQRLLVCLKSSSTSCEEKPDKDIPRVELANWLFAHAEDLQKQLYRIGGIIERCEL